MANGNQNQGQAGTPQNQPNQQKKTPPKTDKIEICQVGAIRITPTAYRITLLVVIDDKNGKSKTNTPFRLYKDGEFIAAGRSDNEGKSSLSLNISYDPYCKKAEFMAEISGTDKRGKKTIDLPYPAKIELDGTIKPGNKAYVAKMRAKVLTVSDLPRPHCPLSWSLNNEVKGQGRTDANGHFEFEDSISRKMVGDELEYLVSTGNVDQKLIKTVPGWKKQSEFTKILNSSENWKHNRKEAISYVLTTTLLFGSIYLLCQFTGWFGKYIACLVLGFVMWYKVDSDGKRGIWGPIIITLLAFALLDGLAFASIAIILSLPVYIYEELTQPVDPVSKKSQSHPQNPYPKWPVLFGIGMIILIMVSRISLVDYHGTAYDHPLGAEAVEMFTQMGMIVDSPDPSFLAWVTNLFKLLFAKVGTLSINNWISFCVILTVYKSRTEVMDFFTQKSSGTDASSIAGFFFSLKEIWQFIKKNILKK